ncbi:MAG: tetratricopeptide repeat protein [Thiovulaceae bacterium]|nr:tetratricopeptide repeat protein [Sulfurimonadaceae bacterium]
MSLFQILMIVMSAFFSLKVYQHIQTLEDEKPEKDDSSRHGFSLFDSQTLAIKADEAFEKGDLKKAFALLDEANVKDPNNAEILGKLGYISAKEERDNEAISYYQEALYIEQNNDIFHNALASLYRKSGEFTQAEEHYKKALQIDAAYEVTYYNYANLLVDMQRFREAFAMYEKALEINPELSEAKTEMDKIKEKI